MKTKRILFTCGVLFALAGALLSLPDYVDAGAVAGAKVSRETVLSGRKDAYNVNYVLQTN